jgi:peptidyl-tRNA hydrolase
MIKKDESLRNGLDLFRETMQTSAWDDDHGIDDSIDPVSMIIIMKTSKGQDGSPLQTLEGSMSLASTSMLSLFSQLSSSDGEYHDLLKRWVDGRIRKVVKHVKSSKYAAIVNALRARDLPLATTEDEDNASIVLPPLPESVQREEWFKPVHKLQLQGYKVRDEWPPQGSDDSAGVLLVTVNSQLGMSPGKIIAQYLHAVQVAVMRLDDDAYDSWAESGYKIIPTLGIPSESDDVIIHDAGFTEIPAGSFTASAFILPITPSHEGDQEDKREDSSD